MLSLSRLVSQLTYEKSGSAQLFAASGIAYYVSILFGVCSPTQLLPQFSWYRHVLRVSVLP